MDNNSHEAKPPRVYTGRVVEFEEKYRKPPEPSVSNGEAVKRWLKRRCNREKCIQFLHTSFPFVRNLRKYKFREDFASDVIAGFTVGIMQIPQGMAYALLSSLPPICGLYISFFSPLVYFFLGTSRHASMGCIAIVSLMIGSVIESAFPKSDASDSAQGPTVQPSYNVSHLPGNITMGQVLEGRELTGLEEAADVIELAAAVSIISGFLMILFGRLGLGFITTYMPEPMVSGFTSGVAIHVTTSQVKHVLGLKIRRQTGIFKIIKTWRDVFVHIAEANYIAVVMSVICMIVLYLVKICINQRYKSKMKIPVPIEIIVVILASTASHFGKFHDLSILKEIPAGLPKPSIPNPAVATGYLKDAFIIGIVAFTQSVSMAKILARKNNYSIDPNQEMVAYGASSVVCSLFLGYIPAASVARSMVQDGAGGKTQVASLFGCIVVLVVILAVGPLFYSLPKCVLSSVILVNLRGMFLQFLELKPLWRKSKMDFIIWIVTFCATVILDADIGIAVGIVFSVFTVACRTQRTQGIATAYVDNTYVLKDISKYRLTHEDSAVKIIQFHAPVYFANAEQFVKYVYKRSNIDPEQVKKARKQKAKDTKKGKSSEEDSIDMEINLSPIKDGEQDALRENSSIVLDFSGVSFVDIVGVKVIKGIMTDYGDIDVKVFIAGCNDEVISTFKTTDLLQERGDFIYITVKDAISEVMGNNG